MLLTLILPCYNPPQGWEQNIVATYTRLCKKFLVGIDLVIVLDGISAAVTPESLSYLRQNIIDIIIIAKYARRTLATG